MKNREEQLSEKQKDEALRLADKLSAKADGEKLAQKAEKGGRFRDNKVISAIWDKVQILIAIIRSPLFSRSITLAATGALAYLLSPIDVLPDVLAGVGFLDDAFVLTTVLAAVVTKIKSDPAKALKFVDSLPEHLKKPAATLFGLAGGAVAGAKLGSKGGEWLKENSLGDLYEKINPENSDLRTLLDEKLTIATGYINNLLASQLRKAIRTSFAKRITRGLLILVLFLEAVLLTLEPIFGQISQYIASALLIAAYSLTFYSFFNAISKMLPYLKSAVREKDVMKGIETELGRQYEFLRKGKGVVDMANEKLKLNLRLGPEELKRLAKYLLSCFWKECLLFIAGTLVIILSFFLLRHGLVGMSLSLTPLQLLLFPFYA